MVVFAMVAIGSIQAVGLALIINRQAEENHVAGAYLHDFMESILGLRYNDVVLTDARTITTLDGLRTLPSSYAADTWHSTDTPGQKLAFPEIVGLTKGDGASAIWPEYQVNIQNVDDPLNGAGDDYRIVTLRVRWAGPRAIRDPSHRSMLELEARRYLGDTVDYMAR